ncbi:hypothetical protein D6817_03670 [Candidatus Pacearchaeota archaeon]|nr:MAG: hypothetical protein D6817_03670 [Candidatus Pacearchaeota archaeon]
MLPRWHILLGAVFALILLALFPSIGFVNAIVIFLSSFLIDFDHYAVAVFETGRWSLRDAFDFYRRLELEEKRERRRGIRRKGKLHVFHTIEFHLLVFLIGLKFSLFFFIFVGMLFHSITDFVWLVIKDRVYRREFFLSRWLVKQALSQSKG